VLLEESFDAEPAGLEAVEGRLRYEDGQAIGEDARLVSRRAFSGDLAIEWSVSAAESGAELAVRLEGEQIELRLEYGPAGRAELRRNGELLRSAPLPPQATAPLRLVNRGPVLEFLIGDRALFDDQQEQPLAGGRIGLAIRGGEIRIDQLTVERLPWWGDTVQLEGDGAERVAALASRPITEFSLLDPLPARIDPIFRIEVEGESEPLVVRMCGVRESAESLPLLEQALALATIRPYLRVRISEGEPEHAAAVPGEGPFGSFTVHHPTVLMEVDALVGILDAWPTLTLWNVDADRILDRTVPGGPMGRGIWAEIPEDCSRLRLTLEIPGRESIEHDVVLNRR
jgi:hypothetical protein